MLLSIITNILNKKGKYVWPFLSSIWLVTIPCTDTYIDSNKTIESILDFREKKLYKALEKNLKLKKRGFTLFEFPTHNENESVLLNGKDVFMISKILNNFIFKEYKGLGKVYFFFYGIS